MKTIIFLVMLSGCLTNGSSTKTDPTEEINCNILSGGITEDIACLTNVHGSNPTHCAWRGQSCSLDECGVAPQNPGYAVSTAPDGSVTLVKQNWDAIMSYMDKMEQFQMCEISRQ